MENFFCKKLQKNSKIINSVVSRSFWNTGQTSTHPTTKARRHSTRQFRHITVSPITITKTLKWFSVSWSSVPTSIAGTDPAPPPSTSPPGSVRSESSSSCSSSMIATATLPPSQHPPPLLLHPHLNSACTYRSPTSRNFLSLSNRIRLVRPPR